jgi:hypothetical protein
MEARKWYQKKRIIVPALVLFPPLGISLAWISQWSRNAKIGATLASGLLMMGSLANPPQNTTQQVAANSAPVTPSIAESQSQPVKKKLSLAAYNQIQSGMSYQEVANILGKEGKELSRVEIPGMPTTVMYQWEEFGGLKNMNATFQDDSLTSKAQFGLN